MVQKSVGGDAVIRSEHFARDGGHDLEGRAASDRRLYLAIANEGGIDSRYIGQINLYEDYSTVELPANLPPDVVQTLRRARVRQQALNLRPASAEESARPRGGRPAGKPPRKDGPGGFKPRKPRA